MFYLFLLLSIILAVYDVLFIAKTLKANIGKRALYISSGIISIYFLDSAYLKISVPTLLTGTVIGLLFLITHLIIAKGIKLKYKEVDSGMIKTCLLIYLLELPAEEFLYRGILLISLLQIFPSYLAILLSSVVFLFLHLKTWSNTFVWVGSFFLGLICAITVYLTGSIWPAIIIHNLNDFAFLTLINRRNIFKHA